MKIALSGKIASGKTTTANYIMSLLGSETIKVSFAQRLKEFATELFNYDEEKNKDRALLQDFGKAIKDIDQNAWINALDNKIKQSGAKHVVIDDVRFPDELEYCKQNGFITIRLSISKEEQKKRITQLYGENSSHFARLDNRSETALDDMGGAFDYVIDANETSTINEMVSELVRIITN